MKRKFKVLASNKVCANYENLIWLDENAEYTDDEVYEDYVEPVLKDAMSDVNFVGDVEDIAEITGKGVAEVIEDLVSLAYECKSATEFRDKVTKYLKTELGFSK